MEHPDIMNTMQFGYPTNDYLEHERNYNGVNNPVVGNHPSEDIFGTEIQSGDTYLIDENGQVVFNENIRDYLVDVLGVVFYKAK